MKTIYTALAVALVTAGCATHTPPPELQAIHTATLDRISYRYYEAKDYRYVAKDSKAEGNCAVNAMTNLIDANTAGYSAVLRGCRTWQGTPHVYVAVGEWALDNRFRSVIHMSQQECN